MRYINTHSFIHCLRVSGLLKWGILLVVVKNFNHHIELCLGYLEDAKFHLESKASFFDITTSIASFKLFLIAWLREYYIVLFRSALLPKYTQLGTIFQKQNRAPLSNIFSSSNMFVIGLFSANTCKKIGDHRARLREKENSLSQIKFWRKFFSINQFEGNLLRFVRARAHVHALTRNRAQ